LKMLDGIIRRGKNFRKLERRLMRWKRLIAALCAVALCGGLCAQQGILEPHKYMPEGIVEHHGATAIVRADNARPLEQAITAMCEEYGWRVHYEDPPYQGKHDLIDGFNPEYRAAHPGIKPMPAPAGGPFQSTYPEPQNTSIQRTQEEQILNKIVMDYNQSGNPGHFVLRSLPDGSFDVLGDGTHDDNGNLVPVTPILDTPISIPLATYSFGGTIQAIMKALAAKTGVSADGPAFGPTNLMMGGQVSLGGATIAPARDFLLQLLALEKAGNLRWTLLYEPPPMPDQFLLGVRIGGARGKFEMKNSRPAHQTPLRNP
jgi:hypothetical protein